MCRAHVNSRAPYSICMRFFMHVGFAGVVHELEAVLFVTHTFPINNVDLLPCVHGSF